MPFVTSSAEEERSEDMDSEAWDSSRKSIFQRPAAAASIAAAMAAKVMCQTLAGVQTEATEQEKQALTTVIAMREQDTVAPLAGLAGTLASEVSPELRSRASLTLRAVDDMMMLTQAMTAMVLSGTNLAPSSASTLAAAAMFTLAGSRLMKPLEDVCSQDGEEVASDGLREGGKMNLDECDRAKVDEQAVESRGSGTVSAFPPPGGSGSSATGKTAKRKRRAALLAKHRREANASSTKGGVHGSCTAGAAAGNNATCVPTHLATAEGAGCGARNAAPTLDDAEGEATAALKKRVAQSMALTHGEMDMYVRALAKEGGSITGSKALAMFRSSFLTNLSYTLCSQKLVNASDMLQSEFITYATQQRALYAHLRSIAGGDVCANDVPRSAISHATRGIVLLLQLMNITVLVHELRAKHVYCPHTQASPASQLLGTTSPRELLLAGVTDVRKVIQNLTILVEHNLPQSSAGYLLLYGARVDLLTNWLCDTVDLRNCAAYVSNMTSQYPSEVELLRILQTKAAHDAWSCL